MSFLFYITPAEEGGKKTSKPRNVSGGGKVIAYSLFTLWGILILFGVVSAVNPAWLREISEPGKEVEARAKKNYGDLFLREGNHRKAAELYLTALSIKPDMIDASTNLGITYAQMGRVNEAIAILEKTLEQGPEMAYVIYYNLAEIYKKAGRIDEAVANYAMAARTAPFPYYAYREIGKLQLDRENWEAAIEAYRMALNNRLNLRNSYIGMLKRDRYVFGDESAAREAIEANLTRGVSSGKLTAYDDKVFMVALSNDREIAMIYNQTGYAYAMKGDYLNAIPYFELSLNIWPDNQSARNNLNAALEREEYDF